MEEVKKIVDTLYSFNFAKCTVASGSEFIINNGQNEFVDNFRLYDVNKGIIITPIGYTKGFLYSANNGGEIINNPSWMPDVITFGLNVYGLKQNSVYRITVRARNTGANNIITDNRDLVVTTSNQETLIKEKLKATDSNEFTAIFNPIGVEEVLYFRVGKIAISDIIIQEVELDGEKTVVEEEQPENIIYPNKIAVKAYGIFAMKETVNTYTGKYSPLVKLSGKGLSIVLDKGSRPEYANTFILERDNSSDFLRDSFVNMNYTVDFNFNKIANSRIFTNYSIVEVENNVSPSTIKQGYIRFELIDRDGNRIPFRDMDGSFSVIVNKIS